jgi:hypothetical protein
MRRWGENDGLLQLEKIFSRLAETAPGSGGTTLWLQLRWYPLLVLMYAAGIAALSARRFDALGSALGTLVCEDTGQSSSGQKPLVLTVVTPLIGILERFKWLPGHDRHRYACSEHLFTLLRPALEDLLFLGGSYELLFDRSRCCWPWLSRIFAIRREKAIAGDLQDVLLTGKTIVTPRCPFL